MKKLMSDAMGLSDIGQIIPPEQFNMVDADDYILHEDNEKIFFMIKSRSDEYAFTNLGLIHVDGTSAVSKKRLVKRYEYYKNVPSEVTIETAGTIDLDAEIKFRLGGKVFSIDVNKNQIELLKDLYKSLVAIERIIASNESLLQCSLQTLDIASKSTTGTYCTGDLSQEFKQINEYSFNWIRSCRNEYIQKDFTNIFEKYLYN